jgi:hypothetical protein
MPFADVRRGVLQDTWDKADLFRRVHGYKGRRCSAEIMQTHRPSKFAKGARTRHVVDASCNQRSSLI